MPTRPSQPQDSHARRVAIVDVCPYLYVTPLDERMSTLCLFFLSTAPLLPSVSLSPLAVLDLDRDL